MKVGVRVCLCAVGLIGLHLEGNTAEGTRMGP